MSAEGQIISQDEKPLPRDNHVMKEKSVLDENEMPSTQCPSACCAPCIPRRVMITLLCCLGMVVVNSMRVNLAITVITILDEAAHTKVGSTKAKESLPEVEWSSTMVGVLHSVFYVGYLITQIPGGYICTKVPGTRIFGASILMSCALNLLIPVSISELGYVTTCVVRFLQGLCEGFTMPALYAVIRAWFPSLRTHKYGSWILGGVYAGPIIGFPLDGAITHYFSWQYSYYLHGAIGIVWFVLWFFIAFESPEVDPYIAKEERTYILNAREPPLESRHRVPWKELVLSAPVWALVVCHFVRSWMFFLMLTNEPMYLNQFHFSILENGIFSSVPHVLKVMVTLCSGYMADCCLHTRRLSRTNTRKLFTALGFGIESLCCYLLVFIDQGHVAVVFLTLGIGLSGLAVSGWQINHLDLAPDYASVLVGFSATFGTLGGILSPVVVGFITKPPTLENWQKSFILTATLLAIAAVTYGILGSGEKQKWAEAEENRPLTSKMATDVIQVSPSNSTIIDESKQ